MKRQAMLSIDYFDKFECIGNKCEDTCCKNWGITVDKKTYSEYKKLPKSEFKEKLLNNININRESKSDYDYAYIKLDEKYMCPMFSEDGLCEVYLNIGSENMCNTCKTYPRLYNQVDDVLESSLGLSCIEVARNILLRKNPIEFNFDIKYINNVILLGKRINTINSKKLEEKYFNEIRVLCIDLIQNRNYSIEERLIILGLFIKNISDITDESLLLETINTYNMSISNGEFNNLLERINADKTLDAQLEFLTSIYKVILSKHIIDQRFLQDFKKVINSLKLDSGNPVQIKESFANALDNNYRYFINDYEYIYENYLVNYMFKTLFPISKMSLMDTYINLIVNFSIIKMNLIGLCGYYKEDMDAEKVLYFIQSFSKVVEHNRFIIDKIHKYLSKNELNTFAHMVILMGK